MKRITKEFQQRKEEIVETAQQLFSEYGFNNTTIITIANKMNVAPGLIYHYFESKLELLKAIVENITTKNMEKVIKIIDNKNYDVLEIFNILVDMHLDTSVKFQNAKESKIIKELFIKNDLFKENIGNKIIITMYPVVLRYLKKGVEEKVFNIEYLEHTALFLLYGSAGLLLNSNHISQNRENFMNLINKLLGIKKKDI